VASVFRRAGKEEKAISMRYAHLGVGHASLCYLSLVICCRVSPQLVGFLLLLCEREI